MFGHAGELGLEGGGLRGGADKRCEFVEVEEEHGPSDRGRIDGDDDGVHDVFKEFV